MEQPTGIQIDPQRGAPIYRQIYDEIVTRIRRGTYPSGHRLPPTRELARELRTHRNTVSRAFDELEASGLVYSQVGRGTFVADRPSGGEPEQGQPELPWNSLFSQGAYAEPLARLDRLVRSVQREDLVNLTSMYPSQDLLPVASIRRCLDAVLRQHSSEALSFAPRFGVPRLREAIAGLLKANHIPAAADDILITTGSQQALDLLARGLTNVGDALLVEEFTYTGALTAFAAAGATIITVPNDTEGPELDALARLGRRGAKALYLMPNCANPTGATISTARRKQIVAWSHAAGVPLIEDDYGADLQLDDCPRLPALRALDNQVLHVGTFSKRLVPALRVGFLVCPAAVRQRLVALKHSMDLGTSALLQHTLAEFIERGYLRAHLRRILPAYRERRDALESALREHLPPDVQWEHARRGGFVWLRLAACETEEVFEEAQRQGVLISPGALHSVYRATGGGVRLTFCAEPPARLVEGARRLGAALRALAARRAAHRWPPGSAMEGV